MLTAHQRARLHRQELLDTAPEIYPAEAAPDVWHDDDAQNPARGVVFALAVVLLLYAVCAVVWVIA